MLPFSFNHVRFRPGLNGVWPIHVRPRDVGVGELRKPDRVEPVDAKDGREYRGPLLGEIVMSTPLGRRCGEYAALETKGGEPFGAGDSEATRAGDTAA